MFHQLIDRVLVVDDVTGGGVVSGRHGLEQPQQYQDTQMKRSIWQRTGIGGIRVLIVMAQAIAELGVVLLDLSPYGLMFHQLDEYVTHGAEDRSFDTVDVGRATIIHGVNGKNSLRQVSTVSIVTALLRSLRLLHLMS